MPIEVTFAVVKWLLMAHSVHHGWLLGAQCCNRKWHNPPFPYVLILHSQDASVLLSQKCSLQLKSLSVTKSWKLLYFICLAFNLVFFSLSLPVWKCSWYFKSENMFCPHTIQIGNMWHRSFIAKQIFFVENDLVKLKLNSCRKQFKHFIGFGKRF